MMCQGFFGHRLPKAEAPISRIRYNFCNQSEKDWLKF